MTPNTTENNFIISHAQNTTARQPNIFNWGSLVATPKRGRVAFPHAKQLPRSTGTSQSVTVFRFASKIK
jgi:hypothetical protein